MTTPFPFVSAATLLASQLNAITTLVTSTKTASHTLTIADLSTRVIMNSASATTITVNNSIFANSEFVEILNIGAGVCTITAGSCSVSTTGTLALVQNAGGRLVFTAASTSIFQADGVAASSSGLVCVKAETTFTAASSVSADSVFTSTYTNYILNLRFLCSTGSDVVFKFRAGGVATSTNYNFQRLGAEGTTVEGVQSNSQTSFNLGQAVTNPIFMPFNIFQPQLAAITNLSFIKNKVANATTGQEIQFHNANQNSSTQFDGFEFAPGTGTITGIYAVYGYSKTV